MNKPEQKLSQVVIPESIVKSKRTSLFPSAGAGQASMLSEEGYDLQPLIQKAIDSGELTGLGGGTGITDGVKGDIIVSGSGTNWQYVVGSITNGDIAANTITFGKIQQVNTDRLLGRDTAGTGSIEEISVIGGLEFDGSSNIRTSAFTGDVTKAAGSTAQTIAPNAVTNTKLADMTANTLKGNNTGVTGDPIDLSVTQVKTMLAYIASEIANTPAGNIAATTLQAAINELDNEKQQKIQIQDEGVSQGALGIINTMNFVGSGVTVSVTGNTATVTITGGSGGITDGNYGDIQVSGSGTVFTVNTGVITNAKLATMAANTIKSNPTASTAAAQDLAIPDNTFVGRIGATISALTGTLATTLLDVFGGSGPSHKKGLVPTPGATAGTSRFLREDGTWITPSNSNALNRSYVTPLLGGAGGAIFTYSGTPAPSWVRTTASVWTITVPNGTELKSADIFSAAADNPGSNVTINIITTSTVYNQSFATAMIPNVSGMSIASGTGTYAPTTGAANLQATVPVAPSNGDLQLLINNYNAASGLGTGDSVLKLNF